MHRWWLLAVLVVGPVGAVYPQAAGALADTAPADATTLYEDVQLLEAVRTLALTPEQLQLLTTLNTQIRAERASLVALRAEVWAEHREDFAAVLDGLRTGERIDPRDQRSADNALARVQEAQADLGGLEERAARTLLDELTDQQAALVQTAEQAQQLAARTARMGGFTRVGDYVAMELDSIRDLMADEYEAVAAAEARRVAGNVIARPDPDPATLDGVAGVILQMMNQVRALAPPVYGQQRETLPRQIETALGIAEQTAPVRYEDLLRLLRSDRTPTVIALVTGSGGGEEQ